MDVAYIKVGDTARFGNYYIKNDKQKEPIEWKVLEISNDRALLITKDAIDSKPYNNEDADITWEECSLRQWLNNEFINQAFSKEEQNEIVLTNISNPKNPEYGTRSGNKTQDKIFLLSIGEAQKYFKNDKDRELKPTNYAKKQGASTSDKNEFLGNGWWWLRSPANLRNYASFVGVGGGMNYSGDHVDRNDDAVRPALFINL